MIVIPGRGAVRGALSGRFGSEVNRDVEVLGPELNERGIPIGLVGAELLEHRAGEAIEVAERGGGGDLHTGERLVPLLGAGLAYELAVLDADLAVGSVLDEERRAEAAARVAQGDLVGRQALEGDHPLGDPVQRDPRLREGRRQGLEPLPGAQPPVGAPGRDIRVLRRDLVPGVIAAIVDRRDQLASLGTSPGSTGSSA